MFKPTLQTSTVKQKRRQEEPRWTMSRLEALLKDLNDSRPVDFDPEQAGGEAVGLGNGSDSDDGSDAERDTGATDHYVSVGRSALRNKVGVELDDPKYAGKRVSRKAVFEDEDDNEDSAESSDEILSDVGSQEGSVGDGQDAMDVDGGSSAGSDDEIYQEENDSEESGSEENSEESSDDQGESGMSDSDDEATNKQTDARLAKELEELEAEEKKLIKTMSASAKADVAKGMHVRAQISLWDILLDTRIRLQRPLTLANRFPKHNTYSTFIASSTTSPIVSTASTELTTLLTSLVDLRKSLISQNAAVSQSFSPSVLNKRKRPSTEEDCEPLKLVESYWADIHPLDAQFVSYRNATIEKWNSKIQIASGIPLQKKFKTINQSVLSQIKQVMSDTGRLVKRTQLKRGEYSIVGEEGKAGNEGETGDEGEVKADQHLAHYDTEVFDDGDYYQQLLKELVESRMGDTDDPTLLHLRLTQLRSQKKKRKVDTKASKGRKIRFHVHEKIQNFMAPEPRGTWHEEMVEELFSGLLGQSVRDGNDEVEVKRSEDGGLVGGDGFKILV
ncbi:apoptosis-antagonizing transcription factor [Gaertneriomyces semiglobifer]|nr:apoptosis-antagonizing transcription factor [Gaertneriomyces semiglobifer]